MQNAISLAAVTDMLEEAVKSHGSALIYSPGALRYQALMHYSGAGQSIEICRETAATSCIGNTVGFVIVSPGAVGLIFGLDRHAIDMAGVAEVGRLQVEAVAWALYCQRNLARLARNLFEAYQAQAKKPAAAEVAYALAA
jgi:hypothetical protein